MPANSADFRLIDRKVADAFRGLRERTRFLRGLTSWVGYSSIGVPFRAEPRFDGQTKYGFRKMLRLALHGVVSFSAAPLYAAIYAGLAISSLGLFYAIYVLYVRFFTDNAVAGWASLVVFAAFVAGLQLTLMGMIGIYVGRIYEEVKQRPLYLVHSAVGFQEDHNNDQNLRAIVLPEETTTSP
jgi:dolichol-phosphate mannosyltransferase